MRVRARTSRKWYSTRLKIVPANTLTHTRLPFFSLCLFCLGSFSSSYLIICLVRSLSDRVCIIKRVQFGCCGCGHWNLLFLLLLLPVPWVCFFTYVCVSAMGNGPCVFRVSWVSPACASIHTHTSSLMYASLLSIGSGWAVRRDCLSSHLILCHSHNGWHMNWT